MTKASPSPAPDTSTLVCTIGHSNRPLEVFIELLAANGVQCVVDIRTVPKSRHNPQFGQDQLPHSLAQAGINYWYIEELGGLRHAKADSIINSGWRNKSFRGYADHMQSEEFARGLEKLTALVQRQRCTLMCAEAVPWRCHRSMVGDALIVRGYTVEHIIGPKGRNRHKLTPFARVEGTKITYPALAEDDA